MTISLKTFRCTKKLEGQGAKCIHDYDIKLLPHAFIEIFRETKIYAAMSVE
jgi:hypothetical protein